MRKRIAKFTDFAMAMSSLKEFASARKLEPCPSTISPTSLSQLSRTTIETPAKDDSVHNGTKPVEHTILGRNQLNSFGGFTPGKTVHTNQLSRSTVYTPAKEETVHTDTKPNVEHTARNRTQINPNGGFTVASSINTNPNGGLTPGQNIHTNIKPSVTYNHEDNSHVIPNGALTPLENVHTKVFKPPIAHTSLANTQGNPNDSCTPSQMTNSSFSSITPKVLFLNKEKNKLTSMEQGKKEKKVFNGMTLVLDYNPVSGFSLTPMKCSEQKSDVKVEHQAADCAANKNPEIETLSDEQLSSSPVLFTTPNSTPSTSPVTQEKNVFKFSQGENRTGLNSSNLNLSPEASENDVGKCDVGTSSAKDDTIIEESLTKVNTLIESSLATDAGNQNCVPPRMLFNSRKTAGEEKLVEEAREEKKLCNLLDDVNENIALKKAADQGNSLQSAGSKVEGCINPKVVMPCFKRTGRASKNTCEVPSNVRQATRRSSRLQRSSNSTGDTKKKQEKTKEVRI